jgi:hypothetical protein
MLITKMNKTFLLITISIASILLASCNDPDTNKPEDKTISKDSISQNSAVTTQPVSAWAVCNETKPEPPHNSLGWCGPKRTSIDDAAKDTAEHSRKFPTHSSSLAICTDVCPVCESQQH